MSKCFVLCIGKWFSIFFHSNWTHLWLVAFVRENSISSFWRLVLINMINDSILFLLFITSIHRNPVVFKSNIICIPWNSVQILNEMFSICGTWSVHLALSRVHTCFFVCHASCHVQIIKRMNWILHQIIKRLQKCYKENTNWQHLKWKLYVASDRAPPKRKNVPVLEYSKDVWIITEIVDTTICKNVSSIIKDNLSHRWQS